jgi:hypothetical protein
MTQLIENKPPRRVLIATLLHFSPSRRFSSFSSRHDRTRPKCHLIVGRSFSSDIMRVARDATLLPQAHLLLPAQSRVATSVYSPARLPTFLIDRGGRLEIDVTPAASAQTRFLIVAESRFRDLRFARNFLRILPAVSAQQHAAGGERDGEAYGEDVDADADEHELQRERAWADGR